MARGQRRGEGFFEDDDGETRKVGSTWWSSGPVVVMVPSGGVASDGGGAEARCNRCYEKREALFLFACAIFWDGPPSTSYVEYIQVFSATWSLYSPGPGNNLWRLSGNAGYGSVKTRGMTGMYLANVRMQVTVGGIFLWIH